MPEGVILHTITLSIHFICMFATLVLMAISWLGTVHEEVDTTVAMRMDLQEVTVTEFKRNRHNLTPSSVSTIDSKLLVTQELNSLKDLTAVLPNFYMPDYGSRQNSPVYIRGIGTKTKTSAVGFYVDGVPHFENSAFDIDLSDIADIEVYRGPQGTLYGRNAIGGIISVHTHSPLRYQGTHVKVGYGAYNDFAAQFSNYTRLSSVAGFSVAGGVRHNDGFFRNETTGAKADDMNSGFGRLGAMWVPAKRWTFRLSSLLDYSDQGGYPYGAYDPATGHTSPVSYNRYSSYRRLNATSGLNIRYEGPAVSFGGQSSYQFIRDRQQIDQDFMPQDLYFVINRLKQRMASQELTIKSNNDSRYQWIFGVFGMVQQLDNTVETQYIVRDQGRPAHYDISVDAAALYHQSSFNLWRGLSVTAGLRFDYEQARHHYRRDSYKLSTNDGWKEEQKYESQLRFDQLTPKLTLQYLTDRRHLYYVSLTRGYKAGGFNQTFRTDDELTYGPEYNWNYEAGTKLNLYNGRLTAELALFYIDWRRQQVSETVPGMGNVLHNAGHSDSKGAELSVTARPMPGFNIRASYGYTYARFLENKQTATGKDYTGNLLPMVPRNTLGIDADYTLHPHRGIVDAWTFGTALTGIGKIYWTENNEVAQPFYTLLNAKISAKIGRLTCELWGKNLTNARYHAYCFKAPTYFAQMGRPLTCGASVTVRF